MRRLALVVLAAVVAGVGAAWVTVAGADSGGRYRTAVATVGDVSETVSVSGTVDRVNRADVSFATSGVVATLPVSVGSPVSAGDELGTLSTDALQATVDKASADLSAAEAALSAASSSADAPEVDDVREEASAAVKAASDALAAQEAACADPAAAACAAAVAETAKAQRAAQEALQGMLDAESPTRPDATSVADAQAAVDQAKVKLVEAQQALDGATLTSPITGTIASITATVGDHVSAGTAVVVVVGDGAAALSATVPAAQLTKLAAGQSATVTLVGTTSAIPGTVTRVGTLPDPDAESVAYPVTITIAEPPASLPAGGSATASVTVATAKDVLTVPTSAVSDGTVTVLRGDQTTVTPVTVGAVGPTRTEIRDGLSTGDEVVLADLDAPLPTGNQSGGFMDGPVSGPAGGPAGGPAVRRRTGG